MLANRAAPFASTKPSLTGSIRLRPHAPPVAIRRSRVACGGPAVRVQANLITRFIRLVKASFERLVGSYEDPDLILDRVLSEMNADAIRMRQASATAIASQKQMAARVRNMQDTADMWSKRAELAVERGQDGLAREALMRRKSLQAEADGMKTQLQQQEQATEQLRASVSMLERKINEARSKKETLKARAATAKSSMAIQELIGGLQTSTSSAFAAFEKMEEKVLAMEAETEATTALATPDALESRFSMLEGVGGVEDELRALKQGAAQRQPKGALPAQTEGPSYADILQRSEPRTASAVEAELEELRRKARG